MLVVMLVNMMFGTVVKSATMKSLLSTVTTRLDIIPGEPTKYILMVCQRNAINHVTLRLRCIFSIRMDRGSTSVYERVEHRSWEAIIGSTAIMDGLSTVW